MVLHDSTIAHIAKLIQMALLTGTDIVDHLRMMALDMGDEGCLRLTDEYRQKFDGDINDMMDPRRRLDKMLFKQAQRKYKNFKDIYASY